MKIKIDEKTDETSEYASLILLRDKIKKESETTFRQYVLKFGGLLEKELDLRIEIVRLKKIISFCQRKKNYNRMIFKSELDEYIKAELSPYMDELNYIRELKGDIGIQISEHELLKIKKTYKRIAMLIHPDLHPDISRIVGIRELWEKAKAAYECNDLDTLKEVAVVITEILKKNEIDVELVDLTDIESKKQKIIEDIERIKTTNPYLYKNILCDNDAVNEKENELRAQIKEHYKYVDELQSIVKSFVITEILN